MLKEREYPLFEKLAFERGIKKNVIAKTIGISPRSLNNKLNGSVDFRYQEAKKIKNVFFPDQELCELFQRKNENPNT